MHIAISVAHSASVQSIITFEKKMSRLPFLTYDVFLRHSETDHVIDNYYYVDYDNPFYETGNHKSEDFYLSQTRAVQLGVQPTLFGWWANDLTIRKHQLTENYDAVVALEVLDWFDFEKISGRPSYGEIVCGDDFKQAPLTANFQRWFARPSDYSRLVSAWKFFKHVDDDHLALDMHAKRITIFDDHKNYLWKYWLDVQNIHVKPYEV